MTLAEKLTEVGNNRPKLYKKGALDYSPQETVSGEAIGITDISPIEHNMTIKVSGIEDISTVKLYKQGKNLIKFPFVNSTYNINYKAGVEKTINGITFTVNDDGSVYARGTAKANTFFNLCMVNLNTNYSVAIDGGANGTTNKITNLSLSKRVVYQESNELMYLYIPKGVTIDEVLYPQIEYGLSQTEYEPYIEPTIYDVPTNGIVEGVTSLYPSTTLYTDTSGAVIDCTYYQDGRKVKENLTDMILSLGGVINE